MCPGCQGIYRVSHALLEQAISDQGKVFIAVIDQDRDSGSSKPLTSSKGSYAIVAQVLGVQRLADSAMIRTRAEDRVLLQVCSVACIRLMYHRAFCQRAMMLL